MNSDDVRREFEQWARGISLNLERYSNANTAFPGRYHSVDTERAWVDYQAAAARYGAEIEKLLTRIAELEQILCTVFEIEIKPDTDLSVVAGLAQSMLQSLRDDVAIESETAERRQKRATCCCFCGEQCEGLEGLKRHSAVCWKHPRAIEVERLEQELARLRDWQPIETAPTGTLILCCDMAADELRHSFFVDWIVNGKTYGDRNRKPTHWMPLPQPPQETTDLLSGKRMCGMQINDVTITNWVPPGAEWWHERRSRPDEPLIEATMALTLSWNEYEAMIKMSNQAKASSVVASAE